MATIDIVQGPYSARAIRGRLDANITELATAISNLLALDPESDINDFSRRLSSIACHARNTAAACGDLKSANRRETEGR